MSEVGAITGRVPQGTCGLKFDLVYPVGSIRMSGPARDLWIEIVWLLFQMPFFGRVPQGTCGLKYCSGSKTLPRIMSGPARDLWIEIEYTPLAYSRDTVGSRKGPVD